MAITQLAAFKDRIPADLAEMQKEAELFKWVTKALCDIPYLPLLGVEGRAIVERLLAHLETFHDSDGADNLVYAQTKTTLLYSQLRIQARFDPQKIEQTLKEVQRQKDDHPEDFILARLLVKSLTALHLHDEDQLQLSTEKLKEIEDKATQENSLLIQKHDYSKLTKEIDYFRIRHQLETLPIQ